MKTVEVKGYALYEVKGEECLPVKLWFTDNRELAEAWARSGNNFWYAGNYLCSRSYRDHTEVIKIAETVKDILGS